MDGSSTKSQNSTISLSVATFTYWTRTTPRTRSLSAPISQICSIPMLPDSTNKTVEIRMFLFSWITSSTMTSGAQNMSSSRPMTLILPSRRLLKAALLRNHSQGQLNGTQASCRVTRHRPSKLWQASATYLVNLIVQRTFRLCRKPNTQSGSTALSTPKQRWECSATEFNSTGPTW